MRTIIKSFSKHGTLIQPDTLEYIMSKENPEEFTSFVTKHLKEFPLILTLEHVKQLEKSMKTEETPSPLPIEGSQEIKEIQTKMLSSIYDSKPSYTLSEDVELEFDDPDKEDQIEVPEEDLEEPSTSQIPQVVEIKKVKTWKPPAKEYNAEIKVIKDVTGNSLCEGTTDDFTKLFVNRYNLQMRFQSVESKKAV